MLDHTDKRILEELSKNSRLSMKDLGELVHLTGPAVAARVAKLEDQGVIEGYTISVNREKLGYFIHAFITIMMPTTYHQPYLSFLQTQEQYVLHNYKISGDGCYLLECQFPTNERLNDFLKALNKHANYKLSIVIAP
ncbi:transcriptional regulator [Virgibacillus soli]|uniref:Lrp/AsnC family transcriptional regulator n=1 Tax=Lederbergia galactosidilytica TaxID=217031 RepID=UPI000714B9B5|nr:Lrp/AsnC family transcriptional regulator [Lederbergia galactosidilytica]KRG13712.1 transcriptional regulator [Virgibacillus soli]MBP1916280.1 Lrp/AsnC family leucine-responsive transcriptional regulator [Lederbergia galactosidilytica]